MYFSYSPTTSIFSSEGNAIKFLIIVINVCAATDSLKTVIKFCPFSIALVSLGSIGILPRNGTVAISANDSPPPEENMFVHSEQCGHTNPHIFSRIPTTFNPVFLQKVSSRRTSPTATACGVVTRIAPSQCTSLWTKSIMLSYLMGQNVKLSY